MTATGVFGAGLAAPFSFTGGAYPGVAGTCGAFVTPGGSCVISVTFSPVMVGANSDIINLDYNDGAAAQLATRDVTGSGTP